MDLATRRADYARRLEENLQRVAAVLSRLPGMQRVSVFGSAARGRRDLFTDLDLFVVWDTDRPPLDRLGYLHSILGLTVDADIVCYTPAEVSALGDRPLLRRVAAEAIVLWERAS